MTTRCHLAVVSPNKDTRAGVKAILAYQETMRYEVYAFADYDGFMKAAVQADGLLLDTSEMDSDVIAEWLDAVTARHPGTPVMVTSWTASVREVAQLITNGAQGYVHRALLFEVLVNALELLMMGEVLILDRGGRLAKWVAAIQTARLKVHDETVLRAMARGESNEGISHAIGYSVREVHRAQDRLRRALNVSRAEQVVDAARQQGLLDDGVGSG